MSFKRKTTKTMGKAKPSPLLVKAMQHHRAGKLEDARTLYERLLEKQNGANHAETGMVSYLLGGLYSKTGEYEKAIKSLERSLALDPDNAGARSDLTETYNRLGLSQKNSGDIHAARRSFEKALNLSPTHINSLGNLANALTETGKLDDAEEIYLRLTLRAPDNALAYTGLGRLLEKKDQTGEAIKSYEIAIKLDPGSNVALGKLVELYITSERHDAVAPAADALLAAKVQEANVFIRAGGFLLRAGETERGKRCLVKGLDASSNQGAALLDLSLVHKFEPDDPLTTQIESLLASGDFSNASDETPLRFALAKAYEDTGRYADAFAQLERGNALRKKEGTTCRGTGSCSAM